MEQNTTLTVQAPTEEELEAALAEAVADAYNTTPGAFMDRPRSRRLAMWRGVTGLGADASRHLGVTLSSLDAQVNDIPTFVADHIVGFEACADEVAETYDEPHAEGVAATVTGLANNLKGFGIEDALVEQHGFEAATLEEDVGLKIDLKRDGLTFQVKPASDKKRIHHYDGDFDVLAVYAENDDGTFTVAFEESPDESPAYRRAGYEG